MRRGLWITGAVGLAVLVLGCDEKSKEHAAKAKQATKEAASSAGEAIKEGAKAAGEVVKDAAVKTGETVGDAAVKTGEALKEGAAKLEDPKSPPATDAATPAQTMRSYLDSLSQGNSLLAGVKSPADATAKLPDLRSTIDSITAKAGNLLKLSPDQQSALRTEFKDALASAISKFRAECERISKDEGLGKVFGDTLKDLKLFE